MLVEVMKLEYQLTPFNGDMEEDVIPDDSASVAAFNGGQEDQDERNAEVSADKGQSNSLSKLYLKQSQV